MKFIAEDRNGLFEKPELTVQIEKLEELVARGNLADALDLIQNLSQEERKYWQIQNLIGVICVYCDQHTEAVNFFTNALEQHPNDPNILYNLADTYARLGLDKQAKDFLDRCEQKDSGNELTNNIANLRNRLEGNQKKYLVICNGGYPAENNPRCMFAHERVLYYMREGLDVDAFGFIWDAPLEKYEFEGVKVTQGGASVLQEQLKNGNYDKLLIHFVDTGVMYAIQNAKKIDIPMIVWCHGYEVLPWYRCWFNYSMQKIEKNRIALDRNDAAQKHLLEQIYMLKNIHFIFISNWQMRRSEKFVGCLPINHSVIPNFINYEFFTSPPKKEEDRLHILSIKNHASRTYGNDLTAKSILELSKKKWFSQLTFELYGRGILFQQNFGELMRRNFPNVHIHEKFLSHEQIRNLSGQTEDHVHQNTVALGCFLAIRRCICTG